MDTTQDATLDAVDVPIRVDRRTSEFITEVAANACVTPDQAASVLAALSIAHFAAPAQTAAEDGWQRMTEAARDLQRRHIDKHHGDVYHAMQSLAVKFGAPRTGPMFQDAHAQQSAASIPCPTEGCVYVAGHLCACRTEPTECVAQSAPPPAAQADDDALDLDRATELAERLVAPGPKASHVSASETHEIAEFVHLAVAAPRQHAPSKPGDADMALAVEWLLTLPRNKHTAALEEAACAYDGARVGGFTSAATPKGGETGAEGAALPDGLQRIRHDLWGFVVVDQFRITKDRLDAYVELGLMERVQRSPALYQLSSDGQAIIDHWRGGPCDACNGRGLMPHPHSGDPQDDTRCPECDGTGRFGGTPLTPGARTAKGGEAVTLGHGADLWKVVDRMLVSAYTSAISGESLDMLAARNTFTSAYAEAVSEDDPAHRMWCIVGEEVTTDTMSDLVAQAIEFQLVDADGKIRAEEWVRLRKIVIGPDDDDRLIGMANESMAGIFDRPVVPDGGKEAAS